MSLIPASRPLQNRGLTVAMIKAAGVTDLVAVLAIRGYYLDSMGAKGRNDRGIYDDALIVVSPDCHVAFNGNTDPSVFRKHIATLQPGVWRYRSGIHGLSKPKAQQYSAFVQAGPVTVSRDGEPSETGYFGINIHRGGNSGTSSLGCQTVPPAQWISFRSLVNDQLKRHGQKSFPYVLTVDARVR